jgi:hypothetical protein
MRYGAEDSFQEHKETSRATEPTGGQAEPPASPRVRSESSYRFEETSMPINETATEFGKTLLAGVESAR